MLLFFCSIISDKVFGGRLFQEFVQRGVPEISGKKKDLIAGDSETANEYEASCATRKGDKGQENWIFVERGR